MRIKPIPKKLLIHSVTYKYNLTQDAWETPTWGSSQTISHVRMCPSSKLVSLKDGKQIMTSAMMYHDSVHSTTPNVDLALDNVITFDGKEYVIVSIDYIYDDTKLHHMEVGLL